ncbi:MAG: RND transporter [Clostridiales bacterium]|nr:RND transporter [Clostridiales bacterium]
MKKRFIAIALTLLLSLMLLAGCGTELPAVYVQSVKDIMGYGAMGEFNVCAGLVVARNEVKIERDENRKIAELKVEPGQSVSEGDVLFSYDMDEMQLTIDKAVLEIEQLKNSVTDFDSQIAELEQAKAIAPESEQLSYTVRIQTLETDKKETEYNITVKERELETLKNTVGNGDVTSPVNGRVKAINEEGGYDEYSGMPLPYITLIEAGAYRVKGKVNELNRNDFFAGQSVVVRSRSDAQMTWTGVIAEIDSNPEESNNMGFYYGVEDEMTSSNSYPFYVDLESMNDLLLGQHVYIEPDGGQTEEKTGLMLDASYVMGSEEEGFFVWAANGSGKIEKRSVTVGALDEFMYQYEILDGLTAEDLIAFPDESVQEGAPVTDIPTAQEMPMDEGIAFEGELGGGY